MKKTLPFAQLAAEFDTPLYVYDQRRLQNNLARLSAEITYRPLRIHMPLMANDTPQVLQVCRAHKAGAFVNSPRHLAIALQEVGWLPEEIIYASSNITEAIIKRIAACSVTFHANSLRELCLYGRYAAGRPMGLRLAWPMPGRTEPGRLGLRQNELATAQQVAQQHQLHITGLHVYLGTNISQATYYQQQLEKILPLTEQFPQLCYLDLSGGFSADQKMAFDYQQFDVGLKRLLAAHEARSGQRLTLVLEPGRAVFADTGYFLTRVVEVKTYPDQIFVGVDGSLTLLPQRMLYPKGAHHPPMRVGADQQRLNRPVTICGASTYSRDYLARDICLPPLKAGDLLVFANVGAYNYACLSNYLGIARPAQVLVDERNMATLITPREAVVLAP